MLNGCFTFEIGLGLAGAGYVGLRLVSFCQVWLRFVTFGYIRYALVTFGQVLFRFISFGQVWIRQVSFGQVWLDLFMFGYDWLGQVWVGQLVFGYVCLVKVTYLQFWLGLVQSVIGKDMESLAFSKCWPRVVVDRTWSRSHFPSAARAWQWIGHGVTNIFKVLTARGSGSGMVPPVRVFSKCRPRVVVDLTWGRSHFASAARAWQWI